MKIIGSGRPYSKNSLDIYLPMVYVDINQKI